MTYTVLYQYIIDWVSTLAYAAYAATSLILFHLHLAINITLW